jgi:hypothetical protein
MTLGVLKVVCLLFFYRMFVCVFVGVLHVLQELTTKMVSDGTYLLWDLLIFLVYKR